MPKSSRYILHYRKGNEAWKEMPLTDEILIGRSQECGLILDSSNVSRHHTRINIMPDGIWLTDLGSANGTKLENRPLPPQTPQIIQPGQSFTLGEFIFVLKTAETIQPAPIQSPPGYLLRFRSGQSAWKEQSLKAENIIGRNPDCDLVITDERASRRHAQISLKPDGIWLSDLGSSNGTKINNNRIPPHTPLRLTPGQTFVIGGMSFLVAMPGQSPTPAVEKPDSPFILRYRVGDNPWQEYPLIGETILGRSLDAELVINDSKISRRHAQVSLKPDGVWLTDLGSQNGIRINNQRIPPHAPQQLLPGQSIQMGNTNLTLALSSVISSSLQPQPASLIPVPIGFQPTIPQPPVQQPPTYPQVPSQPGSPPPLAGGSPPPPQARLPFQPAPMQPPLPYPVPAYVPRYAPPRRQGGMGWIFALIGGIVLIICLCGTVSGIGVFFLLSGGRETPYVDAEGTRVAMELTDQRHKTITPTPPAEDITPEVDQSTTPTQLKPPAKKTSTPSPTIKAISQKGDTWLLMFYQDADDPILERDIFLDFNEIEKVGSTDQIHMVSQLDRYAGEFTGDGDWTSTKRFYITKDGDLESIHSNEIADLGEQNMGDPKTLIDFVLWAMQNYPADKYALVLSDHGSGWPGGFSDKNPEDDGITIFELDQALNYIVDQTGIGKFELIGFDACMMAQIEVMTVVAPYANYAVASEETEPAVGWAYTGFLSELATHPEWSGKELGEAIVSSYIDQDQRIVDDAERAKFLEERQIEGNYSAEEVSQALFRDVTLAAVDLTKIGGIISAINDFSSALTKINKDTVAEARTYAQSFQSVFGEDVPPSYIDLVNFAAVVTEKSGDDALGQTSVRLTNAIKNAVYAERHGDRRPGANGISIYYPNSKLYKATYDDTYGLAYTSHANRFTSASLWDDFLAYHYYGEPFNP